MPARYDGWMGVPLHTAASVYALEARLAEAHDLPGPMLMERAGQALLRCLRANFPEARRVLVVAGGGNNGGDGYVLARRLRGHGGVDVRVLALTPARSEAAAEAARTWQSAGGEVGFWQPGQALPEADLVVDGLFGVGLSGPPRGDAAMLIEAVNAHPAPVLAIDVASGVDADRGVADGVAVRARRTLCLLARKRGLYTGAASRWLGALSFDDLGVGRDAALPTADELLAPADLAGALTPRQRGAHKGDHGHVLVLGGDAGMSGAVRIAATAALRSGAGWVSVATRAAHAVQIGSDRPEFMAHGIEDAADLAPLVERADVIAVGPGLGRGPWSRHLLAAALTARRPLLIDADGLNLLARQPRSFPPGTVLTPHPGEAARLLACETAQIERDRFAAARAIARRYGAVVVLKGAGSLIDDGQCCRVCPFGNPGMASAGMGDALSGVIAALMAQGLAPFAAASTGVLAHALAGDAAAAGGERGLLAGDLIKRLRAVLNP